MEFIAQIPHVPYIPRFITKIVNYLMNYKEVTCTCCYSKYRVQSNEYNPDIEHCCSSHCAQNMFARNV